MNKTGMTNPFAASVSLVTAQTVIKKQPGADKAEKVKEPKSTDKIKVFLACVPSLEDAKNDLKEIVDQVDEGVRAEVDSFISQIEGIQVKVLEFTQMTISQSATTKPETAESASVPESSASETSDASINQASLADVLASRIDDSEIAKIVLANVGFSGGNIVETDRSSGSKIRQIPDATR